MIHCALCPKKFYPHYGKTERYMVKVDMWDRYLTHFYNDHNTLWDKFRKLFIGPFRRSK